MILYIATAYSLGFHRNSGYFSRLTEREKQAWEESSSTFLEAYWYAKRETQTRNMKRDGVKVFLDSGAFSAFMKNKEISISDYCQYIKDNHDLIKVDDDTWMIAGLDDIKNAEGTYANQLTMEYEGIPVIPTFHYGEDYKWLEFYANNYPYIALGGTAKAPSSKALKSWLDRCWCKYLTKEDGKPICKVHGFAVTSVDLMNRYPWYSVDSSTWVMQGNNGAILLPSYGFITVSEKSPNRHTEGRHYDTFKTLEKHHIEKEVEARGFEMERLRQEYISRWVFNMAAFQEVARSINTKEFSLEQQEVFA